MWERIQFYEGNLLPLRRRDLCWETIRRTLQRSNLSVCALHNWIFLPVNDRALCTPLQPNYKKKILRDAIVINLTHIKRPATLFKLRAAPNFIGGAYKTAVKSPKSCRKRAQKIASADMITFILAHVANETIFCASFHPYIFNLFISDVSILSPNKKTLRNIKYLPTWDHERQIVIQSDNHTIRQYVYILYRSLS